ncbi:hypothetical protein D5086_002529 [Populus alba]|uniref:Uncharacterized protein n=1 Tax=Populus alba TaxID=43335 RepID=A0ACC4D2L7_POPAL
MSSCILTSKLPPPHGSLETGAGPMIGPQLRTRAQRLVGAGPRLLAPESLRVLFTGRVRLLTWIGAHLVSSSKMT